MTSKKHVILLLCTILITTITGTRQLYSDSRSHYLKAWDFFKQNKYFEAERYFKKAIKAEPDNGKYNNMYGWFLTNTMNRPKDALPYSRKALNLMPDDPHAVYYCAEAYKKPGNYKKALLYYTQSLERFKKSDKGPPAWNAGASTN